MHIQTSEEQMLIAGCKQNASWARKKLYEQYAPAMLGLCTRYANNREMAKDMLQEGFIVAFTKINTFSGKGSFEGWMRRVFVTAALNFIKENKFDVRMADISTYNESIDNKDFSAVEKLSAEEIMQCISMLPPGCRLVFNLHAIEGYSHVEIADMLHIKEGTSRSQFAHARQLLQTQLTELQEIHQCKNKSQITTGIISAKLLKTS
jgi:RNA polymerase sigma-70 factor (ECF subfamily)